MFDTIITWWENNGFALLTIGSILFFLICWILGVNKRSSGKLSDYLNDILNDKPKRKRNTNKTENKCREIVENIFQKPFPSVRPDFLKNPETGKNLECDMFNEELKICIERQGEQHYKHVEHFHKGENDFVSQKKRDALKAQLLKNNGYELVEIPYTIHYDVLEQYIPHILRKKKLIN